MMWQQIVRGSILGLCVIALVGCSDSPAGSVASPTAPSPAPSVNLTGSWSGMLQDESDQRADEGAPGPRGDNGPYCAYFRDPEGNKFLVFRHGPDAA